MNININKHRGIVTVNGEALELIFWNKDPNSHETAAAIIHSEMLQGRRAVFTVSSTIVSMTYPHVIAKLQPIERQLRHAICEAYDQTPVVGKIGNMEIDGKDFEIHYDLSPSMKLHFRHLPEGTRQYNVDNMITLVGPTGCASQVVEAIDDIVMRVNGSMLS